MNAESVKHGTNLEWANSLELNNILIEKIFIIPSKGNGLNFKRSLSLSGYSLANVRMKTLDSIADELCKVELYKRKLTVPENVVLQSLMINVLKSLENRLQYFKVKVTPETSAIILNAILELKMAFFTEEMLKKAVLEDKFYNRDKSKDIELIFIEYNKALALKGYLDKADLYIMSAEKSKNLVSKPNQLYILPSNIKVSAVEKELLEAITKGRYKVWNFQGMRNMKLPDSYFFKEENLLGEDNQNSSSALSYLDNLEEMPTEAKLPQIKLIQAYGESNEVKEVLRGIKMGKIKLDEAIVFCSDINTYGQLYYNLSKRYEVPVTIESGINVINSNIGRLIYGLIEWIESNYRVDILIRLLVNQYIKIDSKDLLPEVSIKNIDKDDVHITNTALSNILIDLNIGWGRKRYISKLDKEVQRLKELKEDKRLLRTYCAKKFIEKAFKIIPEANNLTASTYALFDGLIQFIEEFGNTETAIHGLDAEAKDSIIHSLKLLKVSDEVLPLEEVTSQLKNVIDQIKIGSSEPKPGHLHITDFSNGIWISRKNNFIVGLDSNRFPGVIHEDPILLDYERKSLSYNLALQKDKAAQKVYELGQLLVALEGCITCSYSSYSLSENKVISPSKLFLQLFRLVTRDFQANYSKLEESFLACKEEVKSGVLSRICYVKNIDESLDAAEFWVSVAHGNKSEITRDSVLKLYEGLKYGHKAMNSRNSDKFSEYDGNINIRIKELKFSSNKLERLAACPFGYFIEHVLYIRGPKIREVNTGIWLEAVDRGQLLHGVFEQFYRVILKLNETPSFAAHKTLIHRIAENIIETYREELTPPNEVVYQREREEIFNSCYIFLKSEESYFKEYKVKPKYFELDFGVDRENEGAGALEAVVLELENGKKIKLTGIIDRIDELEDGSFSIVDYKTGSPKRFENAATMENGRILQHAVYSFAAEKILQDKLKIENPKVAKAIYMFPTARGMGKKLPIDQDEKIKNQRNVILKNLMGIIENGNFIFTDNIKDCEYCGYNSICDREKYSNKLPLKLKDDSIKGIEFIRGVKNYE